MIAREILETRAAAKALPEWIQCKVRAWLSPEGTTLRSRRSRAGAFCWSGARAKR